MFDFLQPAKRPAMGQTIVADETPKRKKRALDDPWAPTHDPFEREPFVIDQTVGPFGRNAPDDIRALQKRLAKLDRFDLSVTGGADGYPGQRLIDSIKSFQKDAGLKTDGLITPGGPTERALSSASKPTTQGAAKPAPAKYAPDDIKRQARQEFRNLDQRVMDENRRWDMQKYTDVLRTGSKEDGIAMAEALMASVEANPRLLKVMPTDMRVFYDNYDRFRHDPHYAITQPNPDEPDFDRKQRRYEKRQGWLKERAYSKGLNGAAGGYTWTALSEPTVELGAKIAVGGNAYRGKAVDLEAYRQLTDRIPKNYRSARSVQAMGLVGSVPSAVTGLLVSPFTMAGERAIEAAEQGRPVREQVKAARRQGSIGVATTMTGGLAGKVSGHLATGMVAQSKTLTKTARGWVVNAADLFSGLAAEAGLKGVADQRKDKRQERDVRKGN